MKGLWIPLPDGGAMCLLAAPPALREPLLAALREHWSRAGIPLANRPEHSDLTVVFGPIEGAREVEQ